MVAFWFSDILNSINWLIVKLLEQTCWAAEHVYFLAWEQEKKWDIFAVLVFIILSAAQSLRYNPPVIKILNKAN